MEDLENLSEVELKEVAEYLAFLKFRARHSPPTLDESLIAVQYAEFADEDRHLAEEGLSDYVQGLMEEDVR